MLQIPIAQSDIRTAFEVFDKDKNGVITKDELYSVLTNLDERVSTEELNSIMKAIDPNGDGKVGSAACCTALGREPRANHLPHPQHHPLLSLSQIDYREFVELLTK